MENNKNINGIMDEKLPNKSEIHIKVNTRFRKFTGYDFGDDDNYDMTKQIEKAFHNAIHKFVERLMTENDDLEQDILEILGDDNEIPKKVDEFMKLGQISIQIFQDNVDVKNLEYTDEDKLKCKKTF